MNLILARTLTAFIALLPGTKISAEENPPPPPGIVIHHSPASSGRYIGTPAICIAPNGDYLASHDYFGPKSGEHVLATGRLYRSTDKGQTWEFSQEFDGWFWTGLTVHDGNVYAIGTDKHHGRLIIRRSTDSGKTWTSPQDA